MVIAARPAPGGPEGERFGLRAFQALRPSPPGAGSAILATPAGLTLALRPPGAGHPGRAARTRNDGAFLANDRRLAPKGT